MIRDDDADLIAARDEPCLPSGEGADSRESSPTGGEPDPAAMQLPPENGMEALRRQLQLERDRSAALEQQVIRLKRLAGSSVVVSDVAHTLNNMLTGALGFTHLLGRSPLAEAPREQRMLNTVSTELTRCAAMTRNLLSYSRNLPRPEPESFDLFALVELVAEQLSPAYADFGIYITTESSSIPAIVFGVREQVFEILKELLENARRAIVSINHGGWIKIRLTDDEKGWRLEISDSGGGVREPERAFEPFYTTLELSPGAGLGLAMAKSVLREHGGRIYLTRGEEGAIFTLCFPRSQNEADLSPTADTTSARTR